MAATMTTQIERGLALLELLAGRPEGAPLSDIAAALGLPLSAAHRLLAELVRSGYVRQLREQGDYGLTIKLVALGLGYLGSTGVVDVAQPSLDRLAQVSAELVRLAIAFAVGVIYMLVFYALGSWLSGRSKALVNGLVVALVLWLSVVLIIPQIGDTMDPDNQVPGGLFAALQVKKADEKTILANFSNYELIRNSLEETSFTKHYERFTFAVTGIKDKYNGKPLSLIVSDKRGDIGWMALYSGLLGLLMWLGFRRESAIPKES